MVICCCQVHCIEPRASHSKGVASPNAEFNFERRDANLDVRPLTSTCFKRKVSETYLLHIAKSFNGHMHFTVRVDRGGW